METAMKLSQFISNEAHKLSAQIGIIAEAALHEGAYTDDFDEYQELGAIAFKLDAIAQKLIYTGTSDEFYDLSAKADVVIAAVKADSRFTYVKYRIEYIGM
jgi:hypothetical protein